MHKNIRNLKYKYETIAYIRKTTKLCILILSHVFVLRFQCVADSLNALNR
jgi:hypothetical protein